MSFKSYVAPLKATSRPLTAISAAATATVTEGIPTVVQLELKPERPEPAPSLAVTSSDPTIAVAGLSHNNAICVLGIAAGSADITVDAGGGLSAVIAVTVEAVPTPIPVAFLPHRNIPATGLAITANAKTLTTLQQFDISAIVTPYDFNVDTVIWSSSDSSVAIVADISRIEHRTGIYRGGHTATIRGIKPGTATITANIGTFNANCAVTVV